MDQHHFPSVFRRPVAGLALLAAVALVVGLVAWPSATEPTAQSTASYASLQDVLRDGQGKGFDKGMFDVWASISPTPKVPTAWVWVVDSTVDGDGVEYWAYHLDYVHPGADEDAQLTFSYSDDSEPADLDEFVNWILANNSHVGGASELTLTKNVVSVVE